MSAAGEWRRINLEQVIPSVSDVFSKVHPSQADDVGSIPITRSHFFLLCNQHRRLVIGGLCWLAAPPELPLFNSDTHPKRASMPLSGECRGDSFLGWGFKGELATVLRAGLVVIIDNVEKRLR